MSGVTCQCRNGGSRAARMHRIAESGAYIRMQQAYRAFLDHAQGCTDCAVLEGDRCETAQGFWQSYRELRRHSAQRGAAGPGAH